jgi:hypothetical protein
MGEFDAFVVPAAASDRADCHAPAQADAMPYQTQESAS